MFALHVCLHLIAVPECLTAHVALEVVDVGVKGDVLQQRILTAEPLVTVRAVISANIKYLMSDYRLLLIYGKSPIGVLLSNNGAIAI